MFKMNIIKNDFKLIISIIVINFKNKKVFQRIKKVFIIKKKSKRKIFAIYCL